MAGFLQNGSQSQPVIAKLDTCIEAWCNRGSILVWGLYTENLLAARSTICYATVELTPPVRWGSMHQQNQATRGVYYDRFPDMSPKNAPRVGFVMQPDPTLSVSVDQRIAQLCIQFEQVLQAGDRPRIEEFLLEIDESARPQLLRVLLGVELNWRHRAGQAPTAGEYLERFPEYPELVLEVLGQAATELDAKTLASSDQAVETEDAAAEPMDAPARPAVSATLSHRPEAAERSKESRAEETGKRKVTLDDFVSSLTECGLMDQVEVDAFIEDLPADDRPINGKQLAELLYRHKRLTRFQVQAVYQRKTRGLVVGNYVVLDRIGKGGMGQVYKAHHRRMKRVVALKMLPWDTSKSPHAIARFQREAEAAARLNHPNIVTAYDADEARGVHFLVMEYVEGEDLAARIKRSGPLPVRTAVEYILQAAQGLAYAHNHGVIHRDIKPANLLCDRQGTVKVLDMGLARIEQAEGADQDHSLTNTGQVMGTLDYMPPEQALDTCLADARSDVYSLGCSLYYLLTGRHPYSGDTLAKKLLAHRNDPIPLIAARRSDVPASVQAVFAAMVAKEPADRPQTMQEVIDMLERCLAETTAQSSEATESFHADELPDPSPESEEDEDSFFDNIQLDKTLAISQRLLVESAPPVSASIKPAPRPNSRNWLIIGTVAGSLLFLLVLGSIVAMLRSDRGTLVVEVDQPGATVEVRDTDGLVIVRGITDADPLTFSIPPGEGRVQVEKDRFTFYTHDFTLERRGHEVVRARLEPAPPAEGTLRLTVNEPSASVEVLETTGRTVARYRTTNEPLSIRLAEGTYRVLVEKRGFEVFETSVALSQNTNRSVSVTLVAIEQPVEVSIDTEWIEGTFVLTVNEADALVEVLDSRRQIVGRYRTTPESLRITLAEGTYQVRLQKPDFEPFETSLTVSRDEERSLDVTFVAKTSSPPDEVSERKDTASRPSHLPPGDLPSGSPAPAIAPFDAGQAKAYQQAWAEHLGVEVAMENSIGMRFVLIPPGEFDMGSTQAEVAELLEGAKARNEPSWYTRYLPAEAPKHRVRISKPFWLGGHEVTRGQFRRFVEDSGYQTDAERDGKGGWADVDGQWQQDPRFVWNSDLGFEQTDDHPVVHVSWNDATAFCQWLSKQEHDPYHLPTEAQWEYACRAGTTTQYSFGDDAAVLGEYAWRAQNLMGGTQPVGRKKPNAFGVHDMHGNVWEFCNDRYDPIYYAHSPAEDPRGPDSGSNRVLRGASWLYGNPRYFRSAYRFSAPPDYRSVIRGFRIAKTLKR